ncbi:MAG: hypothetical protein ACRDHG_05920, partial [Anaerolineales bacterium]
NVRGKTPIDPTALHRFKITFEEHALSITIDDFSVTYPTKEMKRVFGSGLIRFHGTRAWMGITKISISAA